MILQVILDKLDAELNRLSAIREIVSGLDTPFSKVLVEQILAEQAQVPSAPRSRTRAAEAPVEAAPVPVRRGRASMPRGPRTKRLKSHEATALAHPVPTGPVVVLPAALAKERQARVTKPAGEVVPKDLAPAPVGSLGALIRSLELRSAAS